MNDSRILAALVGRDERTMERVMDKYARLLWPIAMAVLRQAGSEQDVEECVADAFIALWEHPEKFDPERGSLKSYLCILARSRAIDRYRQLTRRETVPLEALVASTGIGPQEVLMGRETLENLHRAVEDLSEPNREILIRRYYYSQKPRQIALALGLTVKQVDNSLFRSKRTLRQALEQEVQP